MRALQSAKNVIAGFGGQIFTMLLNFVVRTVFIYTLSKAFLGINGLFTSILTVLNLSELGLGSAIIFAMYKPVAENDIEKLKTLMQFYRKAYRYIGCVFFALGLLLIPALPYLVKETTDLVNINVVYFLYLLDMTLSYWFFAYRSAILYASQKGYMITTLECAANLAAAMVKLLALLLLRETPVLSFYCYTIIGTLGNIAKNLAIKRRVDRIFPWIAEKNIQPMDREERTSIYKNIAGLSVNKVCMVLNDGVDSTIISAFLGVVPVALFSNYILLRTYVNKILSTIFGGLSASIGNLCAVENTEKKESFFYSLQLTYFWIYSFCAICLWMLYDPFIAGIWLDESWLLTKWEVFLLCSNFLLEGIAGAVVKYRDSSGLFWQTRYRYILSSVLNIGLSIVLVGPAKMGVGGAVLGTTISLLTMLSWDPVLVYKVVFGKSARGFYKMYAGYFLLAMATGGVVHMLAQPFAAHTILNIAIKTIMCLVIPNGIWYLIFHRRPEFVYLQDAVKAVVRKFMRK